MFFSVKNKIPSIFSKRLGDVKCTSQHCRLLLCFHSYPVFTTRLLCSGSEPSADVLWATFLHFPPDALHRHAPSADSALARASGCAGPDGHSLRCSRERLLLGVLLCGHPRPCAFLLTLSPAVSSWKSLGISSSHITVAKCSTVIDSLSLNYIFGELLLLGPPVFFSP